MKYKQYLIIPGILIACCNPLQGIMAQTNNADPANDSIPLIALPEERAMIDIGYSRQQSRFLTSAISTVSGTALSNNFNTSLNNTLYGRLAGLTVNQNSSTGEVGLNTATLLVRGINTFANHTGATAPLVVIDGFIAGGTGPGGAFTQLLPDEIETISVLKDASATAIYGTRGANGVILVTTKRGKEKPLSISFSTQQGFNQANELPEFLGAYQYASLYNEALVNDGKAPLYDDAALEAYRNGTDRYFRPDINWYDEVLRKTSYASNYNLSFNGGTNSVKYFVMLGAVTSNGLLKKFGDENDESSNSSYSRYNFRSNIDIRVTKRLSASLNLGGSVEDKDNPANFNTSGIFNLLSSVPPNAFPVRNPNGSYGGNGLYANPVGNMTSTGFYNSNSRTIQSSLRLNEQLDMITPGLSASAAISFNNYFIGGSAKSKQYERFAISRNPAGDTVYTAFGQQTSLTGSETVPDQFRNYTFQGFLNYQKITGKHNISAMVMFNWDEMSVDIEDFPDGESVRNDPYRHLGGGGRATYIHNEKYILELSAGYLGSERFAEDQRFGLFPAVSLGWIISEESFLRNSKIFDFLKLRASYGLTGNDNMGGSRYMFEQLYPYGASYYFGTASTSFASLSEGAAANPDISWEKERKLNLGLDATLFKNFSISLDVFHQERYDILVAPVRTIPQYLGLTLPLLNEGKVRNQGFEIAIRYDSYKSDNSAEAKNKKFSFFAEANIFYARNKILYNGEELQQFDYQYRTGGQIGQRFGLEAIGFFRDQAEIDASPKQVFAPLRPGDIKYRDQNGDNLVDQNDIKAIGKSGTPEFTAGLFTGLRYHAFDMNIVIQGVTGRTTYLSGTYHHAFQNNGKIASIALSRWTPQNMDNPGYPRLSADNNLNNYRVSSFWQQDGSFIKIRSLELGYNIPQTLANRVKLSSARVFVNGTNLFSFDKVSEGDPETINGGYPVMRTITGGFRIQLN